jgi:hypothetical protein
MAANFSRNVGDLPARDKQSLEHLLGKPLEGTERVYIVAFDPVQPTNEQRLQSAAKIEQVLHKVKKSADDLGVTDDDIDEVVDEAMDHIRRRPDANRS